MEEGTKAAPVQEQAEKQCGRKIQIQARKQPEGPPVAPDKNAVAFQTERLQHTHHDKGEKPSGKPHVKKIVAHVHGSGMYRQGRQHKAGKNTGKYGNSQIDGEGEGQQVYKLCYHRRQTGAEESRINVAIHAGAMKPGIEPGAKQHGQDVDRIFPKESKTGIDKKDGHGQSRKWDFLQTDQKDGESHHKPRVEKGGAEPCQLKIIRDKGIPCEYDDHHAAGKIFRRGQKKGGGKQEKHRGDTEYKHFPSFQFFSDVFHHTKLLP